MTGGPDQSIAANPASQKFQLTPCNVSKSFLSLDQDVLTPEKQTAWSCQDR
jgi:hypothetical protein